MKTDLEDIKCDEYLLRETLQAAGATIKGRTVLCPFHHNTNTAAGSIRRNAQGHWKYHCFGCSPAFEGSVIDVLMESQNLDDRGAIALLTGSDSRSNAPSVANAASNFQMRPDTRLPPLPGLKSNPMRPGLPSLPPLPGGSSDGATGKLYTSLAAIKEFLEGQTIGARIVDSHVYTSNDGAKVSFTILKWLDKTGAKNFWQCYETSAGWRLGFPPGHRPLFNAPALFAAHSILVVEGEKCADIANAILPEGYAATTWPGGKNAKMEVVDWSPVAGKRLAFWPDFDPIKEGSRGGFDAMNRAIECVLMLNPKPSIAVIDVESFGLPDGGDIEQWVDQRDTMHLADLTAALASEIDGADVQSGVGALRKLLDSILDGNFSTLPYPHNWKAMTETKSTLPGSIHLICGSPGSGKSWFVMQTFYEWAATGVPVSLFMAEKEKKFWMWRALAYFDGNSNLADDDWNRMHRRETNEAYSRHIKKLELMDKILTVSMSSSALNQEYMLDWIKAEIDRGQRVIGIDPVTKLRRDKVKHGGIPEADENFMEVSADLVKDKNVTLVYVSHPSKTKTKGEPTMDDMAGGAAYTRFCDSGMWLRSMPQTKLEVRTAGMLRPVMCNRKVINFKTRSSKNGTNAIGMYFDPATLSFAEQGVIVEGEK